MGSVSQADKISNGLVSMGQSHKGMWLGSRMALLVVCTGVILGIFVACAPGLSLGASSVSFVLWSGSEAGGDLHGVSLNTNGRGSALAVGVGDRTTGKVKTISQFSARGLALTQIQAAALNLMHVPSIELGKFVRTDRLYAAASLQAGKKFHEMFALSTSSPELSALLAAINSLLPASQQLIDPGDGIVHTVSQDRPTGRAHARVKSPLLADELNPPDVAPCPVGQSPTEIVRSVPLSEAAGAQLVSLSSKGTYHGDSIAVDATWGQLPDSISAPINVTEHVEFIPPPGPSGLPNGASWADTYKQIVEPQFNGQSVLGGGPYFVGKSKVVLHIDARERAAGDPPTPCYNQIRIVPQRTDNLNYSQNAPQDNSSFPSPDLGATDRWPRTGEWQMSAFSPDKLTLFHEGVGHNVLRQDDAYDPFFKIGTHLFPIPWDVYTDDDAALKDWARSESLSYRAGVVVTQPKDGHDGDVMSAPFLYGSLVPNWNAHLFPDVIKLIGETADRNLEIVGNPGDILLNKIDAAHDGPIRPQQDMVIGTNFSLRVPYKGSVHVDGLVAYCMDHQRAVPELGAKFDVLGPAQNLGGPAMLALQRVAQQAASLQPGSLAETPGAQEAIWRVMNDRDATDNGYASAILNAVGISPSIDASSTFGAPHLIDPNTDGHSTAAVTQTGVLSPIQTVTKPVKRLHPRIVKATVTLVRPHPGTPFFTIRLRTQDMVSNVRLVVSLARRKEHRWQGMGRSQRVVLSAGGDYLVLASPSRISRGRYRLTIRSPYGIVNAGINLR